MLTAKGGDGTRAVQGTAASEEQESLSEEERLRREALLLGGDFVTPTEVREIRDLKLEVAALKDKLNHPHWELELGKWTGFSDNLEKKLWKAAVEVEREERWEEIFQKDPQPPKVLIDGLIPRDVFGLVGPGAVTKSTFMLWLMIHVVLGRPVFGMPVTQGSCLYVTQEDPKGLVYWRLRQLSDALGLSWDERKMVANNLPVEDWTTEQCRFVQQDRDGNLYITNWPDDLAEKYEGCGIVIAAMDPAVYFGPGERFVNDAESALMKAGRRLSRALNDAAVGFIHHTGQAVARERIKDQYASRGGSAFSDNARGMLVMHMADASGKDPWPPGVNKVDIEEDRAIQLNVAKFSAGKRPTEPFWILRDKESPWMFTGLMPQGKKEIEREQAMRTETEFVEQIHAMLDWLMKGIREGNKHSKEQAFDLYPKYAKLSRRDVKAAVAAAEVRGWVEYAKLPPAEIKGRRTHYLQPLRKGGGIAAE